MDKTDIGEALAQVGPTTKAARLRAVMPLLEAKIAQGVQLSALLDALRASGIELTEATLRSYLYRDRKRKRAAPTHQDRKGAASSAPVDPVPRPAGPQSQAAPVSLQELDRIMKPDPVAQAADLARYERLAKQQRRNQQS